MENEGCTSSALVPSRVRHRVPRPQSEALRGVTHSRRMSDQETFMVSATLKQHRIARQNSIVEHAVQPVIETLEGRRLCSVSAIFLGGVLTVLGDNKANSI